MFSQLNTDLKEYYFDILAAAGVIRLTESEKSYMTLRELETIFRGFIQISRL
ncbi:hypothetical protein [Peribacillus saganii]|uniref:hypothetical protein n=1 Tax=Peribacillus saganii TaxID=2303992 RepID=UPI001313DFC8|nr:hypothetical protein [Peribacillus saganii]